MAQIVGKYAAKKMLSGQLKKYANKEPAGQYDPYYEYRTDPRTGKQKKYKKQIPAYIPTEDATILASVRKRAYRLDMSLFNFLGVRFGWSSVVGLVPAIGDGVDGAMALLLVRKCNKVQGGLPQSVLMQMMLWVVIDFLIGLVPFVGDLLDASLKANSKNVRILEEHLDQKYKPKEVSAREKREREEARARQQEYHPPAPATVYQDMSDDDENLPVYSSRTHSPNPGPRRPEQARVSAERRAEAPRPQASRPTEERRPSKGWFSGGSERERTQDVEMGRPGRSSSKRERDPRRERE